ncbi:GNAT family N-acetyltransferase [Yersinia ruckeri]|uniref:Protein ElaA n=1 Tax=Yersinia ruckeri TaxID=29486 RepID=A0A0A8VJT0_YERRU|nr:GNAT family N-acetyltransferase [Yersinia ruckeri]EEP98330.1 Acetyltransferase, GNAT family [Yersinia ruckeri ATCC 29473]EKN3346575.1 GNAT family N-acetyltransferase [Yersinia ruckeri]EKN3362638.1 GNAT family N-acetyltransferase [Yersinia ruckeri]EKN4202635.1 GNAT family N-acetyltransferase [Yersinia ruckeri]EKN4209615.1 GNAT family N-acetyltransferase [Yersinia ruckeri]
MIVWQCVPFSQLNINQLYDLIKLRIDVFVVEQSCPYSELDNKDRVSDVHHLLGYQGDELIATARLLPAGVSYPSVSIGRVATQCSARGNGLGHQLLQVALMHCQRLWPEEPIEIGAQLYLSEFYSRYGFIATSESYLEDGIPHIDMKLMGSAA